MNGFLNLEHKVMCIWQSLIPNAAITCQSAFETIKLWY